MHNPDIICIHPPSCLNVHNTWVAWYPGLFPTEKLRMGPGTRLNYTDLCSAELHVDILAKDFISWLLISQAYVLASITIAPSYPTKLVFDSSWIEDRWKIGSLVLSTAVFCLVRIRIHSNTSLGIIF